MWCSDPLISLSLALFLNSLSPGVLKLSDGKFFLGNSYTSYFSFLSHFIFDCVLLIFAVIWISGKTLIGWSAVTLGVLPSSKIICRDEKTKYITHISMILSCTSFCTFHIFNCPQTCLILHVSISYTSDLYDW